MGTPENLDSLRLFNQYRANLTITVKQAFEGRCDEKAGGSGSTSVIITVLTSSFEYQVVLIRSLCYFLFSSVVSLLNLLETKYAYLKLGDIVYVELPTIGDKINVNDQCAVVESVKAVSEVYSPASGTIIEVNPDVEKNTKIINQSPLDEGWLFKLRLSDLSQIKDLLSEENYDEFLTSES
ncbi:unnamed protein product [Schistosoma margrebowiei]|uniref:Glycine cleavage system H protein n=1 Tax=Schistosoma margrebowiei TaxID=48269 RepID=A0AA85ANV3_9TREM|nr:unnamed protein product [Schistosoma margrebowiei]